MTMLKMIGFESDTLLEWDSYSGGTLTATGKRTGNWAVSLAGASWGRLVLPAAESEVYLQYALYTNTISSSGALLKWKNGATVLGTLYYDQALSKLKLYTGDSASLVATGTKALSPSVIYLIELHIKIADSGGVLELRIDTISDASFTGDTKPGSETNIDTFDWTAGATLYQTVDDIIINNVAGSVNNSWPNGLRIVNLAPTGAGSLTEWTPTAGANYTTVDEIPPVMTDNNGINVNAKTDLFAMADLPADAATVAAIMPAAFALKTGAPAVANLKTAYKNAGVAARVSANHALTTSMAQFGDIIEVNLDNGSAPFTPAEVNAIEGGYQSAT